MTSAAQSDKLEKLGLDSTQLFKSADKLLEGFYSDADQLNSSLDAEIIQLQAFYKKLAQKAEVVDYTLKGHAESIGKTGERLLKGMEKKMARATRQKYTTAATKLRPIRASLFPSGKLQERHDNMGFYYAHYGEQLFDHLLEASLPLESRFTVVRID